MNIAECKNSEKHSHKSIGIGLGNTFCQSIVMVLIMIIVVTSIAVISG